MFHLLTALSINFNTNPSFKIPRLDEGHIKKVSMWPDIPSLKQAR